MDDDPRTVDGYSFAFDAKAAEMPAVWGRDDEILQSSGEGLMLVAPEGVGKTSVVQQLMLARAGIGRTTLLGYPVKPAARRILYIAADRPRQASRSLRRMVTEDDRARLEEMVVVHRGPLPFDIATTRTGLAEYARDLDAGEVIIDSLKDVAVGLSKDEIGSAVNIALQYVIADGRELVVLHHHRKPQPGAPPPKKLEDVYGSRWLTAGMGSVILLWGEAGDPIVNLRHLKQPLDVVGPFDVLHDHAHGISTVHDYTSLEQILEASLLGLTARDAARLLYAKDIPKPNETEKARRKLEALVKAGRADRHEDKNDGTVSYRAKQSVSTVGHTVSPPRDPRTPHETQKSSHTNGHTALTINEGTRGPIKEQGQRGAAAALADLRERAQTVAAENDARARAAPRS